MATARDRATNFHNTPPSSNSDATRSLIWRGSPVAATTAPVQKGSFGIHGLELMHKYSTETFQSLSVSDSETQIWRITVPRLALKHEYLMNGILALASMHIATSLEPAEKPFSTMTQGYSITTVALGPSVTKSTASHPRTATRSSRTPLFFEPKPTSSRADITESHRLEWPT